MRSVLIIGCFTLCCISSIRSRVPEEMWPEAIGSRLLPGRDKCGIGHPRQATNSIDGGQEADLREFPWMARVRVDQLGRYNETVWLLLGKDCTGSLISERYVLTAAHCVTDPGYPITGENVRVMLGDQKEQVDAEEITRHERYVYSTYSSPDDIAIIRLNRDVKFTDSVFPICMPDATYEGTDFSNGLNDMLIVAGWRRTEQGQSSTLLTIGVPVAPCSSDFPDRAICAGGQIDAFKGDSGGPLMNTFKDDRSKWFVEGVLSGGGCEILGLSSVYARVSRYINWIHNHIRP